MSERIFGSKKVGTSTSNPSLVSATTPTLGNLVRGFDIANKAPIQASSEVSTDLQAAQSAGEQSWESQAIKKRPLHDISSIALRRPQAKLTVGEPGDQYEQEADRVANQVMSMPNTAMQPQMTPEEQTQEEEVQSKPLDVYSGQRKSPNNQLTHVVQQKGGVLQRDVLQRAPKKPVVTELSTKLPLTEANARLIDACHNLGSIYVDLSVANTDLISTKLRIFSINYDMAYSNYSRVIGQGRAEAQNQTLWRGIFLGIGTGVLAGLAAAYIAPSTAAGWFALTLADAGTAAGSSFLQGAASSAIALAVSDAITTRGSDLQPGGLSPDMLRSNIWQHVASMYRGALQTNQVLANLHKNTVILERLIAEIRVQIAGGASSYSPADILTATNAMNDRINGMASVFSELRQKSTAMSAFGNSILAYDPTKPGVAQIEKDIWIMWMGTLSNDDSDILDLDNIEDHLKSIGILGNGGLLGVDFGDYTSEDDELAALAAARPRAAIIRGKYDQTASQWTAPSP
ncbi:hypothetical protein [Nostoc sp.]|uniref:hypothetical protein n=1 Tax=Nostoc sp. TaxID=1180 RepID=UPI002FFBD80E